MDHRRRMSSLVRILVLIVIGVCAAAEARAQSAIAGVVRDASGALLPGVTVEASSPALIEGTRAAVTDGAGSYRIVDLRPGEYAVTFTLTGFRAMKRDGITLPASFTATVNVELSIGQLEESITSPANRRSSTCTARSRSR